jgi:CHAD domain-containing protein
MTTPETVLEGAGLEVDGLIAAAPKGLTATPGRSVLVRRRDLDTFDGRLGRAGLQLVAVVDKTGARLVLTERGAARLTADGIPRRLPALAADLPAGPLASRVGEVAGIRALIAGEVEGRQVREVEVRNRDAKLVLRLELDIPADGSPLRGARVVLRSLRGYEREAARYADRLRLVGLRDLVEPDAPPATRRPSVLPDEPAARLLTEQLTGFRAEIVTNVPGVVDDVDTEFLHDLRVAVRRTRSTLKLGRDVLPPTFRTRWEPFFKGLGDVTTPVRDLDVYELGLAVMSGWLVAANTKDLEPFARHLRRHRTAARKPLVRALRDRQLTASLEDWAGDLAAVDASAEAGPDARSWAQRTVGSAYRRVVRDGASIGPGSPAENLHALRKRCKELRYALEVCAPALPGDVLGPGISDLKTLQDVLGRFQDSDVQRHALHGFAVEMLADGVPAAAVLAMGELVGHLDADQARARHEFGQAFARFVRPANTRRFQQIVAAS